MKLLKTAAHGFTLALSFGFVVTALPAQAQATRTWVSGVGDDVNPCSRTAPCKTFAGAISKTAAGGEINCIDQGAYGAVTITKSIALVCEGVTAGVLHSATNGIVINAAATDHILLRGLDINGGTPSVAGLNGVRFLNGGSLTIDNCLIRNSTGAAPNGNGVNFAPAAAARLIITNTTINNNGSGILVQPTGAGGSARVDLVNVRVSGNSIVGLKVDTTGNTSATGTIVSAVGSQFSGSPVGVSAIMPTGSSSVQVMVRDSAVDANSVFGLASTGTGTPVVRIGGSSITGNGAAVFTSGGGTVRSYGNNQVDGNVSASSFSGAVLPTS